MTTFRPKFITFDCYGTLTHFEMAEMSRSIFGATLSRDVMNAFIKDFSELPSLVGL